MTTIVLWLYVLGAVTTAGGLLTGYLQAKRRLKGMRQVEEASASHPGLTYTQIFEHGLSDDPASAEQLRADRERQAVVADAVASAGFIADPVTEDPRLPAAFVVWRADLLSTISSFRTGGLIALLGVALSTTASIWSLYLP